MARTRSPRTAIQSRRGSRTGPGWRTRHRIVIPLATVLAGSWVAVVATAAAQLD